MTRRSDQQKSPRGKFAQLAREVRLLVAPTLGDWNKVLQLSLLLVLVTAVVTAGCVLVVSAAGDAWPLDLVRAYTGVLGEG